MPRLFFGLEIQPEIKHRLLTIRSAIPGAQQEAAELKPAGNATVGRLADFMAQYENRRVRVEGYTDSTGAESYNQQLSERRAEAVRDALAQRGISRARIEVQGFGEQYPVAANETSAGRQQNRRVEIVISDADGNIKTR